MTTKTKKKRTVVMMQYALATKRSATQSSTANLTPSHRPPEPEELAWRNEKKMKK
jgi:hypothetical protein